MKIFLLLFLFISPAVYSQSAKEELFKRDLAAVVEEMELIYEYDELLQSYAHFRILDKSNIERTENLPDSMQISESFNRKLGGGDFSRENFRKKIERKEEEHTARMIAIIKKYGFPSIKRISQYTDQKFRNSDFSPFVLLQNAPRSYWKKIKRLMRKEYKAGRISQCSYGFLLWHLSLEKDIDHMLDNGYVMETRNGVPYFEPTCE
ncbi:hypothetical protein [Autumnicola edwardsiae]|uniref:Uncharacterized protein n=1 Tax=Autumnicola edwardsiae TaxID=3075594 RepID=A0ABU3CS66_9FLAO|nr:hypothetical protein [Zunongwangia sp. F297]MDT0649202.1 hypothetical protein [Zunongwangia sp. F297]